jgi:hypothetical protein
MHEHDSLKPPGDLRREANRYQRCDGQRRDNVDERDVAPETVVVIIDPLADIRQEEDVRPAGNASGYNSDERVGGVQVSLVKRDETAEDAFEKCVGEIAP